MNKQLKSLSAAGLLLALSMGPVFAHCQIPCGIYGDDTRFTLMLEHVATIEKSMKEIERLGTSESPDPNQLVRWVTNKEAHADKLADITTFYFMAQRIKPVSEDQEDARARYVREITLLHQILVQSMKAKQTINLEHCRQLKVLIGQFQKSYIE